MGMPWRISTSLPVQHRPARLMPWAPSSWARFNSSGSRAAWTTISETRGEWPWRMIFTWSALSTPRLTWEAMGLGVPKRTSESSVAIMEPPQPSASAARRAWSRRFTGSLSTPMWVRCSISAISQSMPRG